MSNSTRPTATKPIWQAFTNNVELANTLTELNRKTSAHTIQVHRGNIDAAIKYLSSHTTEAFLIIDISADDNVTNIINNIAQHCPEGTRLIAIGKDDNLEIYRELKRLGVDDYFALPVDEASLLEAIQSIEEENVNDSEAGTSQTSGYAKNILITGTHGGVGTTTIALNLAWILAEQHHASTCLIDWDMHHGVINLALDLQANRGLHEALENPGRLDVTYLKRLVMQKTEHLAVFATDVAIDKFIEYSPKQIQMVLNILNQSFDVNIFDIPYYALTSATTLINNASELYIVVDTSLASARNAARIIQWLQNISAPPTIQFIHIKHGDEAVFNLFKKQFEEMTEYKFNYIIPYNKQLTTEAIDKGKVLAHTHPRHNLITKLKPIAQRIYPLQGYNKISGTSWLDKIGRLVIQKIKAPRIKTKPGN